MLYRRSQCLPKVALTALALMALPGIGAAQAPQRVQLDIPAQDLSSALTQFGRETGTEIVFAPEAVRAKKAVAVKGEFERDRALQLLLEGSGLTYRVTAQGAIVVEPSKTIASAAQTSALLLSRDDNASNDEARDSRATLSAEQIAQDSLKSSALTIDEVIVTAQKREERLQDVPISISVLSGFDLDRSPVTSVNDVLRTVPGISSYENIQGAGMSKFSVRGVTSNASLFNGSSTVGYYLDEIPFAFVRFPISPDANAYDLERVEVLRGPQGTLYGANALNGVIRIMTQDANLDEAEFKARTTLSSTRDGGENYRGDLAAGIPLIPGKLAVRAVAGYADYDGWIDQPFTGREDVNDVQQKNLRLKVNAAPTEKLSVELQTWISRDDRGSTTSSRNDRTVPTTFAEAVDSKIDAHGLTLVYDFDAVSVLSSTSHLEFEGSSILDNPLGVDLFVTRLNGDLTSQEVRLNSRREGPWKWSVGGIYRNEKDSVWQDFTLDRVPPFIAASENLYESRSFAVYGELSRLFLGDKLELTGGLRYFEDETSSNEKSALNPADVPFGKQEDDFDAVTPRVVLSYRPGENATYYASYSQGFRSGFAQQGQVLRLSGGAARAVEPDRLTNYEIGTKGVALGSRLSYDVAVYFVDWKDAVQVLGTYLGDPANNLLFFGAINSQGIDGPGVDVGANFRVTSRLQLGATFSWNDLAFAEDVFSGATLLYPKGIRPVESPKLNAGANIRYTVPVHGNYSASFAASGNYTTKMLSQLGTGTSVYGDNFLQAEASVSLISPSGWSAMLFVDNLTDEDARIRAPDAAPRMLSDRLRPRTVGLHVDYQF